MAALLLLGLQIALSLVVSGVLIALLRPVLFEIFLGTCGTTPRASFWLMFTQINLVLTPLLLVIFLAPVTDAAIPEPAQLIRDTLVHALIGVLVGVAAVGQVVWKTVKVDLAAVPPKALAAPKETGL